MSDQKEKQAGLKEIREQFAQLKDKRESIAQAPPTSKVLINQKHEQVDAILDSICSPENDISRFGHSWEIASLFVAAFADQLKKNIAAHIEKTLGGKGLTPQQKTAQLAELDRQIIALERVEEALCMALEADGMVVVRRGDLNPAVFFEVGEDATAGVGAKGAGGLEHAAAG